MKQGVIGSKSSVSIGSYEIFVSRIQALQKIYAQAGYFIRALSPYPHAKENFLSLPKDKQNQINTKLSRDLDFYIHCIEKKERLNNVKNIVEILAYWQRIKIPNSVMDKIRPNSLVELYDQDLIQRYRSANFFSYTSHSLEDLESRPYYDLFKRSEEVNQKILSVLTKIVSGEINEPDFQSVGKHRLWEINSPRKLVTQNKTVVVSPIFHEETGATAGFIHVCQVLRQTEFSVVRELSPSHAL